MPGLSHSRSDKVICCSFPNLEAIKVVHWVKRFERPLPSNSFKGHHYLLYFPASLSLYNRQGSVPADISAVSWSASAGVASTALIFCILCHLIFPQLWQVWSSVMVLWPCFLLPEPLPNWLYQLRAHSWQEKPQAVMCIVLALVLTAPEVRAGFAACHRKIFISWGAAMLLSWQQCAGCDPWATRQSIGQESSGALPAALHWRHWTVKLILCEI